MKYPPVQYQDYLGLEKVLDAQNMRSTEFGNEAHDEMLFIITHQTYELWFKQVLFEIDSIINVFSQPKVLESQMGLAVSRTERIVAILRQIIGQIDVLETMTPMDFLEFRDYLYPASGFQSYQFRLVETKLGLKIEDRLQFNNTPFYNYLKEDQKKNMLQVLEQASLFDLLEKWLERIPFLQNENFSFWQAYAKSVEELFNADLEVVKTNSRLGDDQRAQTIKMIESSRETFKAIFNEQLFNELREKGQFRLSHKAIQAALFIQLYRDEPVLQQPFRLITALLDIDEILTQWRYRHSLMAHRMLGRKIGTGGTSGHDYLKTATDKHKIYNDLFNLTTFMIPRSRLPSLPDSIKSKMNYTSAN